MCYKLDTSKPIHVIKNEPENERALVSAYAQTIQCTENQSCFGSQIGLWVLHYPNLKLTKQQKRELRLARFHNNKDQEREVYARALSQLEEQNKKKNDR
jgi:hypothetical protein